MIQAPAGASTNPRREAAPGRLLLVAHHFPPSFAVGAFRPRRMAIHLERLGWEVAVLAAREMYLNDVDPAVCRGLERVRVYRTHALNVRSWLRRIRSRRAGAAPSVNGPTSKVAGGTSTHTLGLWLATRLEIPDAWWGWIPVALVVGSFLPRPDVILTTAPAFSNFLVAAALSIRFRAPLVLDYRDPWNPLERRPDLPSWRRRLDAALERWCAARAAEIVVTTPGLAREVGRVTNRPVQVVTNACEPERAQRVVARVFDGPTLVYAGGLYGDRTLDPLLDALSSLRDAGRIGPEQLQILYMGRTSDAARRSSDARGLEAFVRVEGNRPNEEALAATAGASCNLTIVGAEHAQLVPAKIFEHLVAGRPMLVITPPGSDTEDVLRAVPWARCIAPDDGAAMEQALLEVASGDQGSPSARIPEYLTAEATVATLHRILNEARRRGAR